MKYKRWGEGRGIMKYRKTGTEELKLGKRIKRVWQAPPSARTANMGKSLPVTHRGATQKTKARWDILAVLAWGRGWRL
jgi:hypothetical protein